MANLCLLYNEMFLSFGIECEFKLCRLTLHLVGTDAAEMEYNISECFQKFNKYNPIYIRKLLFFLYLITSLLCLQRELVLPAMRTALFLH